MDMNAKKEALKRIRSYMSDLEGKRMKKPSEASLMEKSDAHQDGEGTQYDIGLAKNAAAQDPQEALPESRLTPPAMGEATKGPNETTGDNPPKAEPKSGLPSEDDEGEMRRKLMAMWEGL